jgi:argininosuccinate lyase
MGDVVEKGKFNLEEMRRKAILDYAGSSEAHDRLVYDFGVPFRTGHRVLGALVRNHFQKEPPIDLNQMLEKELGRPFAVDQNEIMDIVLVKRIWPSMFDFPMLRETLADYEKKSEAATKSSSGNGAVEQAIEKLLTEARSWLAKAEA